MRTIRLPQLQNVAQAGGRVSLRFPLGQTYEKVYLAFSGVLTTANVSNIVFRLNNREFIRWNTVADMNAMLAYKGNLVQTNILVFDFTERLAREELGMKLGTIAATADANVQDFTLEFDLSASGGAGGITGWADVGMASANPIIQRVTYAQKVIAAAAQEQIYIPFGSQGQQVKRLLLKHANLTSVRIRRDGVDVFEDLPIALVNQRETDFGRTPQAGYTVIDLMPDALQSNALNTALVLGADGNVKPVQNLDIRLTTSAADTITYYVESYDVNSHL